MGDARAAAPFHALQGHGLGGGGPDGQGRPGFGLPGPADRWEELRDTIHAEVMANGFDAERNTFVQSYGRPELDASLLLIPRVGFLPPDDPRVIGTIDAIQRELTEDGFVLRYRPAESDDGLPGDEGVFLACSFWLVEALLGAGRAAGRPRNCSSGCWRCATTSACSARNGASRAAGSWATRRRPSATSPS